MNASLVCLLTALVAQPQLDEPISVYKPSADFQMVVRGQTPIYEEATPSGPGVPGTVVGPTYVVPPNGGPAPFPYNGGTVSPFQPAPLMQDPFIGPPAFGAPYAGMGPSHFAFGANGPQPYQFGWTVRQDAGLIPNEPTEGNLGRFGVTEFDTELEYTSALPTGAIFSFTQQYNLRLWEGPTSDTPAAIGLPGNVHRFGWDFELSTPANLPWSLQLGFNPSINTDFDSSLTSDAWNWDGRGIAFYRASPHWMLALGLGYWDRVNDKIIPYAGAVWTPDDRWEWRLVFPKPRVSYYLGCPFGVPAWLYVSGEYHIEAYQVDVDRVPPAMSQDKIELEDWRVVLGVRNAVGRYSSFLEGGWIFGRKVDFLRTPGFNVSSGFILRGGVQF